MRKALTSLPKELDETYDSAMERIRSQDTESVRVAERALAWITNARRPFYVEELQHALAIQPDEVCTTHDSWVFLCPYPEEAMLTPNHAQTSFDEEAIYAEDDLVSLCAGLVTIDRESHVIRMVHYTAQDYFERVRNEMFPTIQVEIAKACINYLQLDDFESDEYTDGNNYIEVSDKLHSRYPFLDYAGKQWGFHARGEAEYEVGEMICCLLEKKMRLWFACAILDDSVGMWDFGPRPDLTLLIYFGLELLVKYAITLNKSRLTCAIRVRHNTLSFLLAESGADWFDRKGKSIRAECSSFRLNGNEAMVILLVNKGVKMDLSVDNGEFLYAWSLIQNAGAENKEPMLTLLKLGASVDPQNVTSYTQLMTAVIGSDVLDVRALLNAGVDVNEKNEHNRDALTYAASARHEEVVRPLLEAGADIHSRDADGMTALCAACECGNGKIVKLLLENGADISAQDRSGRTPISIATERGHETLARTLRRYGIEGHWEDEAEGKDAVELDRAKFNKLSEFMRRDHELGSPGYKFVESVERATLRQGYDKSMVAFLDAFCEHIANEEKLTTTGEQGAEGLHSELMAFAKEYLKRKEHEKGSTSIETQEPFLANLANERIMVRERLGERMTDAVIKKYMGIEFPLTGSTFVRGVD